VKISHDCREIAFYAVGYFWAIPYEVVMLSRSFM